MKFTICSTFYINLDEDNDEKFFTVIKIKTLQNKNITKLGEFKSMHNFLPIMQKNTFLTP